MKILSLSNAQYKIPVSNNFTKLSKTSNTAINTNKYNNNQFQNTFTGNPARLLLSLSTSDSKAINKVHSFSTQATPAIKKGINNIPTTAAKAKLSSEKLSLTDETFKEIYRLDDESFAYIVKYKDSNEFKNYLEDKKIDTYLVKNKDKELLGYYQIYMPQKDNMYIETINLKPEFRGQKTGFTTHVFESITNIAHQAGAKKLSLHVEVQNAKALNLYKRKGFRIVELTPDRFQSKDNAAAYYMEKEI